jgi:LuxR family maltose regulon positive regulatory protein
MLDRGLECRLILISAPAGYGKTTLLSEWIHKQDIAVSWFSIDSGDDEPARFLSYMIAGLRRLKNSVGDTTLQMIRGPGRLPVASVMTGVLNDLADFGEPCLLIMDDFHLIQNRYVLKMVDFLLEHMPPGFHLILSTRSDPPIPLARLRSQHQVVEIRAGDLSLSEKETSVLFNEILKLDLSSRDLSLLADRTEGWAAGLQLAALSLQQVEDKSKFINEMSGNTRYIMDYLMEEVLERQTEDVQSFILKTSILECLCAPLCNAFLDRNDSQVMLERLEREDLFLFSLDGERRLFRYHRLFRDLLKKRLSQVYVSEMTGLHRRAFQWYQENGFKTEAVDHALDAGDEQKAADLIADIAEMDWDRGRESQLLTWFRILPDSIIASSPRLCIFYARELLENGQKDEAVEWLGRAELVIQDRGSKPARSETKPETSRLSVSELQGRIAVIRASMASYAGDIDGIIRFTHEALDRLPREDLMWRSVAATNLGFAYGWSGVGDMFRAMKAFEEAESLSFQADNIYSRLMAGICVASIQGLQGDLNAAIRKCRDLLALAGSAGMGASNLAGTIHGTLGNLLAEQNEIREGIGHIKKGLDLTEKGMDAISLAACRLNWIHICLYDKNWAQASEMLKILERSQQEFPLPPWMHHAIESIRATIWLGKGNLERAGRWARERGLSPDGSIEYRQELEYLIFTEILWKQERFTEAEKVLDSLESRAKAGNRRFVLIDVFIRKALLFDAAGEEEKALEALKQALNEGAPGRILRCFLMKGAPLMEMIREIIRQETGGVRTEKGVIDFAREIVFSYDERKAAARQSTLLDPLTDRELEVLLWISRGLSNQKIAERCFISLNTVRTHTKNIHSKLNVHSRTQAVARARALGLLDKEEE